MSGFDMGYEMFGGFWLIIIWVVPFLVLVWFLKSILLGKPVEKDETNVEEPNEIKP